MADEDWLQPQQVLDMLVDGGTPAPEAWHIVADAMRQGRLRCRAASIVADFEGDPTYQKIDQEVPCDAWALGGVPAPGHIFWSRGDANLKLIMLPMEVRGGRLSRMGAQLLAYDRSERLPSSNRITEKTKDEAVLPTDEAIKTKMLELIVGGLRRNEAAKRIRHEPGFEAVGNEHARRTVEGELRRGRRPKKLY